MTWSPAGDRGRGSKAASRQKEGDVEVMYLLGVLFMVLAIGVSIALHEVGHLVPAKKFGVACRQYMIGFGPTVWSRQIGETEYGLKAIPLGGYVRMIGMYPPRPGDQLPTDADDHTCSRSGGPDEPGQSSPAAAEAATPATRPAATEEQPATAARTRRAPWSTLIEEARATSLAEIRPGEHDRVFYKLSTPKKLAVMFGGPFMNLVIATVVMIVVFAFIGLPQVVGAQVSAVAECVRPVTTTAQSAQQAPCTSADAPTPAAQAGITPGDRIVSIQGQAITSTADIAATVRPAAGQTITIVVDRGGQQLTLTAHPIAAQMPELDADGNAVTDSSGQVRTVTAGYLGMTSSGIREYVAQPITAVPGAVAEGVVRTAAVVIQLPSKLVGVYEAAFGGQERDETGPMSVVGVGRIAGEVADGQVAWLTDGTAMMSMMLLLVASLNIALFVFNLIPLVPLDGGHIAGALWEGIKRTTARVLHRPDPGYVDVAKAMPLAYGVTMVFLAMGALLIYADIVAPLTL